MRNYRIKQSRQSSVADSNPSIFQLSFLDILEMDDATYLSKHQKIDTVSNNDLLAEFMIVISIRDICSINVKKHEKYDSFCWFFSQEYQSHPFSFTMCCYNVGISDPDWFRALMVRNYGKAISDNEISGLDHSMYEACRKALFTGDYSAGFVSEPTQQPVP
ncbi:hypothetical protein ACF8FF_12795 [Pseudomonas sp. zjy_13]|uniref:hypothetical protein n=1 Tax=Pseudomonas sp. zjy_13 TaxID=3367263 RepID=UPI00370B88BA